VGITAGIILELEIVTSHVIDLTLGFIQSLTEMSNRDKK
jgi:hypothetical protein